MQYNCILHMTLVFFTQHKINRQEKMPMVNIADVPIQIYLKYRSPEIGEWWSRWDQEWDVGCHPRYHGHPCSQGALSVHVKIVMLCPHFPDSESSFFLWWDEAAIRRQNVVNHKYVLKFRVKIYKTFLKESNVEC